MHTCTQLATQKCTRLFTTAALSTGSIKLAWRSITDFGGYTTVRLLSQCLRHCAPLQKIRFKINTPIMYTGQNYMCIKVETIFL